MKRNISTRWNAKHPDFIEKTVYSISQNIKAKGYIYPNVQKDIENNI